MVTMIVLLGTPNLAWAYSAGIMDSKTTKHVDDINRRLKSQWDREDREYAERKRSVATADGRLKRHIQEQTELIKKLKSGPKTGANADKIYRSITGIRDFNIQDSPRYKHFSSGLQSLYAQNLQGDLKKFSAEVRNTQARFLSSLANVRAVHNAIENSRQLVALNDKALSLQSFEEAEGRFRQIQELSSKVSEAQDMKAVSDLQAILKGKQAMIQNEMTKLQMIAHMSEAEQALIDQRNRELNKKILSSANIGMPIIQ